MSDKVTILDVRKAKAQLEERITDLLVDFTIYSDCEVEAVQLHTVYNTARQPVRYIVSVKATLVGGE